MVVNRMGWSVFNSDIVEAISTADVPLSVKGIAHRMDIDPTSEALLELRDKCYVIADLVDIDRREDGAALYFDLRSNYAS